MANLNPKNKLYFYCGILDQLDTYGGNKLEACTPDEHGYFKGYPLSVFGEKSFNQCFYDTESFRNAITSPKSSFNIKLTCGNLYGEWGHPAPDSTITRMGWLDRNQQSHHFRSVYIDENDTGDNPIIRGDVKPCGPCGKYVEESMLSPFENTAFSLRCLMTEKYDKSKNAPVRNIVELITFDCVDMPGYIKASKRFVTKKATECMVPITMEMLFDDKGQRVGLESWSDQDILEIFGIGDFNLHGEPLGCYVKGTGTYIDKSGQRRSITHAFLKG